MKFGNVTLALSATLAFIAPALAHDSFSMFDNQKIVKLDGTVKELQWTNPHSWLRVMVDDPQRSSNGRSSSHLLDSRHASEWSPTVVKPGDKVVVEINPLRDGTRGGALLSIVLPDGTKLAHV
jgi:hypothetical protein